MSGIAGRPEPETWWAEADGCRSITAPAGAVCDEPRVIPRIVHQVAINTALGPELVRNLSALRRLNPGWDCRLYEARAVQEFIERHYGPRMMACYSRISPAYGAAKADLFRYLALYRLGGVYLDLKSFPTRPFDDVIRPDDECLISQWANGEGAKFQGWGLHKELRGVPGGEFQQWFIISRPGHPFLRAAIERVVRNVDRYIPDLAGAGRMGVLRTTGPIAYTRAIRPLLSKAPHRLVDSEADLGLHYSIYLDIDYTSKAKGHYSQASGPVAVVSGGAALLSTLCRALKTAKRYGEGLVRRRAAPEPSVVMDRGTRAARLAAPPVFDVDEPLADPRT